MTDTILHELAGASVVLRPATEAELAPLAEALAMDHEASPWLGTDASVIMTWLTGDGVGAFTVHQDGEVTGVITFEEQIDPDYRSASIDIGLLACAVGKGAGPDALVTLARYLFRERGHHRITIDPAVGNTRAIRAYGKVGFRPVGVMREYERGSDGTWHDNLLMDLLECELVSPADPGVGYHS